MFFYYISTCPTVLDEEKAAEVLRKNKRCVVAWGKHKPNKQVVYGVAEACAQMGSCAVHTGSQVAYAEVDLLRIDENALHIAVHNFAA